VYTLPGDKRCNLFFRSSSDKENNCFKHFHLFAFVMNYFAIHLLLHLVLILVFVERHLEPERLSALITLVSLH